MIFKYKVAICCILAIGAFVPLSHGEKILFLLPLSSKSMANLFEPLAEALYERGHQLTIATPTLFKNLPKVGANCTQIVHIHHEEILADYPDPFQIRRAAKLWNLPVPWQQKFCNKLYDIPEFFGLADQKFDLAIVNILFQDCFAGMLHKIGSPIIFLGSLPSPSAMTELHGTHLPSSFIPVFPLSDISAQLNFKQRVKNFLYNAYISVMLDIQTRPYLAETYRERLGDPTLPSVREIFQKQGSMILMNSHFALTNPRPFLPNIVEIGGIHCQPPKALPKDLQEWADGAKDGLIVFSLGSIVKASQMPEQSRKEFVKAFEKLKQRVVWKWEKDEGIPNLPNNVKLVKWLPQQDLLGHPNTKLFITHGGLLSTEEAVYHGVPVLGMPIFVDQDANMKQAEILGFGVKGEILDLKEAKLTAWIRRVLDDPRYFKRAKELSAIFKDQPETPLERSVFWTEYVIRHKGASHLRSAALRLNLLQYHCIDVIAFLITVVVTTILFIYYLLKLVVRLSVWLCCPAKAASQKLTIRSVKKDNKRKRHYD